MKKEDLQNFRKYYLNEFEYYDGECFTYRLLYVLPRIHTHGNSLPVYVFTQAKRKFV